MRRLPVTHLIAILIGLAALAGLAWYYASANDPVAGLPTAASKTLVPPGALRP